MYNYIRDELREFLLLRTCTLISVGFASGKANLILASNK